MVGPYVRRRVAFVLLAAVVLLGGLTGTAAAERMVIALKGDAVTLDPHMRFEIQTMNIQSYIFDYLFHNDADGNIVPHLALSLEPESETTWLLRLREGVKFHNGEPFNAEAAAYSLMRAKTHERSEMRHFLVGLDKAEVVDEYTVRITTVGPRPMLKLDLTQTIMMVPPGYVQQVGDQTFAQRPIGTGAYQFVEWVRDDHLTLRINPDWWGWEHWVPDVTEVIIRPIPDAATRVAALLSGEIDVAEAINIEDIPRVQASPDHYVAQTPSQRVMYLAMAAWPEGVHGMPPGEPNPFMDKRVRRAVAHAIDVDAIMEFVMSGAASPATQLNHRNQYGAHPNLRRWEYDPEKAKQLLAEAGYPNGFRVRLDAPNDRYVNDAEVAQAIGGMLRDVGIDAWVDAVPKAEFFPRLDRGDSTLYLSGWGAPTASATLNALVRCRNLEIGVGHGNRYRYCNPYVDELIVRADQSFDEEERLRLYHEAIRIAVEEDIVWVPLYHEVLVFGIHNRFDGQPRFDETFYAYEVRLRK